MPVRKHRRRHRAYQIALSIGVIFAVLLHQFISSELALAASTFTSLAWIWEH